ncbi:MAG: serine/threonine-protein kinase [Myxococcota bacterium]
MPELEDAADAPTLDANATSPSSELTRSAHLRAGDLVGRYVVLDRVGQGGMGVVFAAFDPGLDRKVALKLLHSDGPDGRRRMLREAQMLAKLDDPNVITVHDVGEHAGRVFIAMEFVDGQTLTRWQQARERPMTEILAVYLRAGRGLAAAHDRGLVHRDFKPDNVMVDERERVRVMDFGLARSQEASSSRSDDHTIRLDPSWSLAATATEGERGLGTPAYMSPEQWARRRTDARCDQFSFCVALFEALYGQRPFVGKTMAELAVCVLEGRLSVPRGMPGVPTWLDQTLRRGLAVEPDDRFASMHELLRVLSRGQVRRRRRLMGLGVAGLAVLGTGTIWARAYAERRRIAACQAEGARIDEVWSQEVAARVRGVFVATGISYAPASSDTVVSLIDRFARGWRDTKSAVCLEAEVRETWDAGRYERASWCLDERWARLQALVAQMLAVDRSTIEHSVTASLELADVAPCGDPVLLDRLAAPARQQRASALELYREIFRGLALGRSGRLDEAFSSVQEAQHRARALGWPPLTAAALHAVGEVQQMQERYGDAEASLEEAFFEARAAGSEDVAAGVATSLVAVTGVELGRLDDGARWARHAELALDALGDSTALARAAMLSHLGLVERRAGRYAEATERLGRALEIRASQLGEDHPTVAAALTSLGLVAWDDGRYDEAVQLQQRALEINEQSLGPGHPSVGLSLNNLAIVYESIGDYARAEVLGQRALGIFEAAYGPEHSNVAMSLNNLGVVALALGRVAEARELHTRALGIWERVLGPDHPDVAQCLSNIAVTAAELGQYDEAQQMYLRVLNVRKTALGPEHNEVAQTLNNLGANRFEAGAYREAEEFYRQALAIMRSALGARHPQVATVLDNLAEAIQALGRLDEAERLRRRALTIREETLGADHPDLAYSLVGLAQLELARGAPERAVTVADRAARIRDAVNPRAATTALAHFLLAQALWDAAEDRGGDRARALEEAAKAEELYGAQYPVQARNSAELEAVSEWLDERRRR